MSLTREWYLETRTLDKTVAVFRDITVYGSPNVNRNQEAHFIVIAKMDEFQALTFLQNIDNTDPLNKLEYSVVQTVDGAYRLIAFNPAIWSNSVDFLAGTIVYSDGVFYKASQDSGPGSSVIEPNVTTGWESYWSANPDFTLEVENALVDKFIHDDIITFRYEECLVKELDNIDEDILCGACATLEKLTKSMAMQLMLAGANSNNWQDKQTRSEVIIAEATKRFCC